MTVTLRARSRSILIEALRNAALFGALALPFVAGGCENNHVGRSCDVQAQGGPGQGLANPQALECPTRLCIKPAIDNSVAPSADLPPPFCTAECSSDSDCEDGEKRDKSSKTDKRCQSGWTCAVPFVVGDLCCKRLCVCKDFLGSNSMMSSMTPEACNPARNTTCANVKQ